MGVKKALDFRFPEFELSFRQGGTSEMYNPTGVLSWLTVVDWSNRRGTMFVRFINKVGGNTRCYLRITIDGVEYPIQALLWAVGAAGWIFDFNESIKIEHYIHTSYENPVYVSRVEYGWYEYRQ